MTLIRVAKNAEKFFIDNSPAILTAIGVTGTLTVAYLTGTASFRAAELIAEQKPTAEFYREMATPKEKFLLVWKEYIPAVGVGSITVACIIGANHIGARRTAALAAAYSISDKAFGEYKEKVLEKFGENKERAMRDEIAQDQVARSSSGVMIVGEGKVLCFESYTGRYFESTMETIKKAQNDTNYEIMHNSYCSLGDFFARIGLSGTSFSEEVGWNSDHLMEVWFSTVLTDDGKPCLSISFNVEPIRGYSRFH